MICNYCGKEYEMVSKVEEKPTTIYYAEVTSVNNEIFTTRDTDKEAVKEWLFRMMLALSKDYLEMGMSLQSMRACVRVY